MSLLIPRLAMDSLAPDLRRALQSQFDRLEYLGEFYQCLGHLPEPLLSFIEFTELSKRVLDKKLVELIALTVATITNCRYECNQHERLCVRLGYGRQWIIDVESIDPEAATELTDIEKIVQRFVIAAASRDGAESPGTFNAVIDVLGYERSIGVLMVFGRYIAHSAMLGPLTLEPPVPSIFEDDFMSPQNSASE